MPVAKHLSYARSRSRTERPRRIDGPSFAYLFVQNDESPRARAQRATSQRPAIAAVPLASRSILRIAGQLAEAAAELVLAIASRVVMEMLDGCAAYAMAMYGIPEDVDQEQPGDSKPSAPPTPRQNWSKPALLVISTDCDIRSDETFSPPDAAQPCAISKRAVRPEQEARPRAGWRTAIVAPAVRLLSKIRERYGQHRVIAELQNLDDRSLRDIGISRADIGYIARYGARPE